MERKFDVTIHSKSPLIVNRFHGDDLDNGVGKGRKEKPTAEEEATRKLYLMDGANGDHQDQTAFPAENIRQSIIEAAKRFKIGRRSATSDVAAAVYLFPEMLPLDEPWTIDGRAVVIPATGGRIMCHRPMFHEWHLCFTLQLDTDLVDERTMREIVTSAGKLVGIGDFRPQRKGPYGRFDVTSWEAVK